MRKLLPLLLIIPNITHAISVIYPEPTVRNVRTIAKPVDYKTKSTQGGDKLSPTSKPIESWQWAIYEKHKVPVPYRFIVEAIRMKECNQPWGYCLRSDFYSLKSYTPFNVAFAKRVNQKWETYYVQTKPWRKADPCHNPSRTTGDGWVLQQNSIHGEIFDITVRDLCKMREAINEKNDAKFITWRDKLFEDQMLWTVNRLKDILENDKLSWADKVYKSAWRHHSNPKRHKNIDYANDALRNWRKITK